MKRWLVCVGVAVVVTGLVAGSRARAGEVKDTNDLVKKTKVSLSKAVEEAVKASPGTAVRARLVRGDDGAPSWRVVVLADEKMTEVGVDGVSGKAALRDSWRDEADAEKARPPRASDSD